MATFKPGERLLLQKGNIWQSVEFVELSRAPIARPTAGDAAIPEEAAVVRDKIGNPILVPLSDLRRPNDDPNQIAKSIVDRATSDDSR